MRGLVRTFRRMALPIEYSQGFNPRMLVNCSQPLPLGISSKGEWVTVSTQHTDADGFLKLYNEFCTPGFEGLECFYTETRPNIAGRVVSSDYFISSKIAIGYKNDLENLKKFPFIMKTKSQIGLIDRDMSPLIEDIKVDNNGIYCRLVFGNINLRIDNFATKLSENFDLDITHKDIVRLGQLVDNNGKLLEVSEYLKGLK